MVGQVLVIFCSSLEAAAPRPEMYRETERGLALSSIPDTVVKNEGTPGRYCPEKEMTMVTAMAMYEEY